MQWGVPGGILSQSAAGLSLVELLKLTQNVLGLFFGLCLLGLYFTRDACLGLSFREKIWHLPLSLGHYLLMFA